MTAEQKSALSGVVTIDRDAMHGTPCLANTRVPVQTLIAFDHSRQPIFLVAGDKSGGSEKRFYSQLIEMADERLSAYLSRQTIPHLTGRKSE